MCRQKRGKKIARGSKKVGGWATLEVVLYLEYQAAKLHGREVGQKGPTQRPSMGLTFVIHAGQGTPHNPPRIAPSPWAPPTHSSSKPPSPFHCQMGVPEGTETTNSWQTRTRAVDRGPSSRSGPLHASRSDTSLTGAELNPGWEGGKLESTLDAAPLDQDWVNIMPSDASQCWSSASTLSGGWI